jgi:hypothetical protein
MEDVLHRVKEIRNILQTKRRKVNLTGHILRRNCLLKHVVEGEKRKEDGEEVESSYWMTLRERENTGNLKWRGSAYWSAQILK